MLSEIVHQGIKPDKLTYNTLILACVESEKLDSAMQFFEEMKVIRIHLKFNFSISMVDKYETF